MWRLNPIIILALAASIIGLFTFLGPGWPTQPISNMNNLTRNADFETGGGPNGPANWSVGPTNEPASAFGWDSDVFYSGHRSISLQKINKNPFWYQVVTLPNPISTLDYELAAYIKTANVSGSGAAINVQFLDDRQRLISKSGNSTIYYKGSRNWEKVDL